MKPKLHIYLFRHGQTTFNRDKIFTGWKDAKLTPLGIRQAKTVAKKLKSKKFQVTFQTKLSRSKNTLKEVLKFHPECKELITANQMIERNYGIYNGMSHEKFIQKFGEEKFKEIHRGWNVKIPQGENFAQVEKRVKPFLKQLIQFMKKNQVNVAISAHGNSIRLFRKIFEHKSKKEAMSWTIPYDKVFEYEIYQNI